MNHDSNLEKRLQEFSPRLPDIGLKEEVLRKATERALARRVLTPAWKWTLAGCMTLILFIFLADEWASAEQYKRLNDLFAVSERGLISLEKTVEIEMAEYREALPDLDKASLMRLQMALLEERKAAKIKRPLDRTAEVIYEN
jgi:hypothetical protein